MLVCEGAQSKSCSDMQSQCNKKCEKWGKYAAVWCKRIAWRMTFVCKTHFVTYEDYGKAEKMKHCKDIEKDTKKYCDSDEERLKNTLPDFRPPPPLEKECAIDCGKEYTECLKSRRNNQWNHTSLSSGDWRKKNRIVKRGDSVKWRVLGHDVYSSRENPLMILVYKPSWLRKGEKDHIDGKRRIINLDTNASRIND